MPDSANPDPNKRSGFGGNANPNPNKRSWFGGGGSRSGSKKVSGKVVTGGKAINRVVIAAFAYVNGWIDSICLRRYRAFATMMVGNQLTLGNAVGGYLYGYQDDQISLPDPLFYTCMILTFMAGVAIFRLGDQRFDFQPRHFAPIVVIWITCHALFEDYYRRTFCKSSQWMALGLSPIFGIQDAIMTKGQFAMLPWCTTSNMVTVADTAMKLLCGVATEAEKAKWKDSCLLMVFTISGCISGGMFASHRQQLTGGCAGDMGLLVMGPVLGLLFWAHDITTRPNTLNPNRRMSSFVLEKLLKVEVEDADG